MRVETLGRGFAWLDTGNHDALLDAADFVAAFQKRQGLYISCIEEIAYKRGFIDKEQLIKLAQPLLKDVYKRQIYYRTHCRDFGWLAWTKNGGKSGSAGYAKSIEAVEDVYKRQQRD